MHGNNKLIKTNLVCNFQGVTRFKPKQCHFEMIKITRD